MKTIFPEDLSRAHIGGFVASEVREILLRGSTTCWLGQFSSDHVCRREIIRSPGLSGAPGALVSNHPRAHLPLTVSNVDHTRDRMRKETPARTVSWWSCWWCTSTSILHVPILFFLDQPSFHSLRSLRIDVSLFGRVAPSRVESPIRCARCQKLCESLKGILGILPIHDMVSKITSCRSLGIATGFRVDCKSK